ncbi:hypothetical protein IM25_23830 (plasmid) [Rhodococcus sp. p52]|nr:hypothetical protein IM25_23385 [Rhodococcus sp. p52]AOD24769.1 hypothetical protein IM25_23830 [Rhodococcus sp. p52]
MRQNPHSPSSGSGNVFDEIELYPSCLAAAGEFVFEFLGTHLPFLAVKDMRTFVFECWKQRAQQSVRSDPECLNERRNLVESRSGIIR